MRKQRRKNAGLQSLCSSKKSRLVISRYNYVWTLDQQSRLAANSQHDILIILINWKLIYNSPKYSVLQ